MNLRRVEFRVLAALFLLSSMSISTALGQGFTGGRGRFGDGVGRLLSKAQVQKEIVLSATQLSAFLKLLEEDRAANDALLKEFDFAAFDKLPKAEQQKKREALSLKRSERTSSLDRHVKSLLDNKQWTRLNEIRIQQEGVWSLNRDVVQKELGLTPQQITKIQGLIKQANELPDDGEPDLSPEGRKKAREINDTRRQTFEKEMTAVLNADQAALWAKLKGAPFAL